MPGRHLARDRVGCGQWGGSPNEKVGIYAGALASLALLGSNITDKEGSALKENPLAYVAAPKEEITAGAVAADTPKGKSAAGAYKTHSFFISNPLSPETDQVPPLMEEEEDDQK